MGTTIELTTSDGHKLSAYQAEPSGAARGGVLVIQEIFGLNAHIRAVCDDYAKEGYRALAPALFDRVERGVELGYDGPATQRGAGIVMQLKPGDVLRDLQASADELAKTGKVGVVGYCYGGTMTWASACRLDRIAAGSSYYGGRIAQQLDKPPRVPVILHFGEQDAMIPMADIDKVRAAFPDVPVYVYPAGHGFNCDARASYHAESAKLAKQRTLELFAKHVG
ncbi:MAG TPA: dienelactone hydrolase family protein [Polyangiales bacterium]|nr:dienelactone hydrolase family protein [Polyangiales bacterium]